jgi:hypothetical protein
VFGWPIQANRDGSPGLSPGADKEANWLPTPPQPFSLHARLYSPRRSAIDGTWARRITAQISTSTPDKPVLFLEIKTHDCGSLEKAIHATLEYRGRKIPGAGKEWFKATRDEVVAIYQGGTMAALYTGAADRRRLSQGAMHKLGRAPVKPNEAAN